MGTRYPGSAAEIAALDAYIKLMRATESVTARVMPTLAAHDLTLSQFGVLEALAYAEPMCQRALGEKILKSAGNMTTVIDNLEKRALVRRERGERDRRKLTIHLTPRGRTLVEGIVPRHVEAIAREMGTLSPPEIAELGRLCRKLGRGDAATERSKGASR